MQLEQEKSNDVSGFDREMFCNYRVEVLNDAVGRQSRLAGLSASTITDRLFAITNHWPKRIASFLFVPADNGEVRWVTSRIKLFSWLASQLPPSEYSPIRWINSGPYKVSKLEFFDHLRRVANEVDWPTFLQLCPHFMPPPSKAKDLKLARGFREVAFRTLKQQALAFYADVIEPCDPTQGLTIYSIFSRY